MCAKIKFIYPAICLFVVLAAACSRGSHRGADDVSASQEATSGVELPLPKVPDQFTTPDERAGYLLAHFWDTMDWQDTTLLDSDEFMEQNLVNYFNIISLTDSITAASNVMPMIEAASKNPKAINRVAEITSRYLYSENSPMYNPESYEVLIDAFLKGSNLQEETNLRLQYDRESLRINRPGTTAADFIMELRQGGKSGMRELTKGVRTVLMFYDSDCEVCAKVEGWMASAGALNGAIAKGEVRVVAVDPFTSERDKWLEHAKTLPGNWIVGYAPQVDMDEIYHIGATPAIYLLDENGKVLIRDASDPQIRRHVLTADF